ncbi:MAG: hypothetical protein A3K19_08840 [Lentisphaerae bacterium RIFOXYB12_FULL_65_16]|nr:MAG: hypothetical protein A3K18_16425 [Lentisphaerae bacterium RIFOXYA12_64_32]OGV92024.1 MAG: hypothetical protein A3K19_08840 [Lentisphaerae bacterium RIFOXYB12_FULL_65_16]
MSELEFRNDFGDVRQSWRKFWDGTLQRPILLAEPPKKGVAPVDKPAWGAAFSRDDYEGLVDQALRWAETHQFLGDSVPCYLPSLIIDLMPAFLGAEITSIKESWGTDTHAKPSIKDLSSAEIRFRPESIWWEKWVRLAECIKRKCAGRLIFGTAQPYYNNLDTLAALRGNVELMTDFYDNPDGVHSAMKQIMTAHADVMTEVCRILEVEKYGSVTGHGFYADGKAATPQCDFGFNIGKEHFDEFALPYLRQEIDRFDAVEYHLDGPGNIAHAESICGIETVKVVQWVAGVGESSKRDWTWLYEKLNALGKGLWLSADSPKTAVALWEKYSTSGRMILHVNAADRDAMARYVDAFESSGAVRPSRRPGTSDGVDGGELARLSSAEFAARHLPKRVPDCCVRAADFLPGRTPSEAIEAAIAAARVSGSPATLVLDTQDWLIDRAVRLPSNTELVIDGCTLKLADGVHDNIIRSAGIETDPANPNGVCLTVKPTGNIRITGRNNAVLEGADNPYSAANPKTGVVEKWLGDFFGWRTVGIQLSGVTRYEISGFTMRKTHCWAISQEQCSYGYLHDIVFDTNVKNGDGIDFRNGCSFCRVENISGTTSDDTVACTALNSTYITAASKYVYPMQPMGTTFEGAAADIHDIVIRNIRTGGQHHGVICLATSPKVYNITIENVVEDAASSREACVKIYTGYGTGYTKGNLRNITVSNVLSRGSRYAVMVKADVKDVRFSNIKQTRPDGAAHLFEGESENLGIT